MIAVSVMWLALPILRVSILAFLASGLTTTKNVRNAVDELLREKLRSTEAHRDPSTHLDWADVEKFGLSFRLFEKATGKSLRVVATDVTDNTFRRGEAVRVFYLPTAANVEAVVDHWGALWGTPVLLAALSLCSAGASAQTSRSRRLS